LTEQFTREKLGTFLSNSNDLHKVIMMTELDQLIAAAYASEGKQEDVNKVYLTLLRTSLFLPIEKLDQPSKEQDTDEPFKALFAKFEGKFFLLVFDTLERLQTWAGDEMPTIDYVELRGMEIVAGIGEDVYLCLNVGCEYYKEFSPEEVMRLKMAASRIEQLKGS
jgi:hypothetical protein